MCVSLDDLEYRIVDLEDNPLKPITIRCSGPCNNKGPELYSLRFLGVDGRDIEILMMRKHLEGLSKLIEDVLN